MLRAKLYRSGRAARALRRAAAVREHGRARSPTSGPTRSTPRGREPRLDLRLRPHLLAARATSSADGVRESFQDAFIRAWRGEVENDGYNRLVLGGGLTWREVTVLRAVGEVPAPGAASTFSDRYVEQALVVAPGGRAAARGAVPGALRPAAGDRAEDAADVAERIEQAIDAVESLDQDQILREFLGVVRAMLRTNFFQTGPSEAARAHLVVQARPVGAAAGCRSRARASRSSSTRRASRACTCAAERSPAAACAGRTGARTSAPRCSA